MNEPSEKAIAAGAKLAQIAFTGRAGHGGGAITSRRLSQDELAAMLACAYQFGVDSVAVPEPPRNCSLCSITLPTDGSPVRLCGRVGCPNRE